MARLMGGNDNVADNTGAYFEDFVRNEKKKEFKKVEHDAIADWGRNPLSKADKSRILSYKADQVRF